MNLGWTIKTFLLDSLCELCWLVLGGCYYKIKLTSQIYTGFKDLVILPYTSLAEVAKVVPLFCGPDTSAQTAASEHHNPTQRLLWVRQLWGSSGKDYMWIGERSGQTRTRWFKDRMGCHGLALVHAELSTPFHTQICPQSLPRLLLAKELEPLAHLSNSHSHSHSIWKSSASSL